MNTSALVQSIELDDICEQNMYLNMWAKLLTLKT